MEEISRKDLGKIGVDIDISIDTVLKSIYGSISLSIFFSELTKAVEPGPAEQRMGGHTEDRETRDEPSFTMDKAVESTSVAHPIFARH